MTDKSSKNDKLETNIEHNGYLFSIDVLIQGKTNGQALEALTRLLNGEAVTDYRINKGINLGEIIAANMEKPKDKITQAKSGAIIDHKPHTTSIKKEKEHKSEVKVEGKTEVKKVDSKASKQDLSITEQIEQFKADKSLVRMTVHKGKGVILNIPCRILNFDWTTGNITAYHVDEKKVYSIHLSEIDDLITSV